jgi:hypothetical protein
MMRLVRDIPGRQRVDPMGFIIRSVFWLSLVLLVVPLGVSETSTDEPVGALQALSAAREAIGDVGGICERKPEVCVTGRAALQTIGVRARESARIAYELLDERFGDPEATVTTGGIVKLEQPILPEDDLR